MILTWELNIFVFFATFAYNCFRKCIDQLLCDRYLLAQQQRRNVTDLMPMIGARFYIQLDSIQSRTDILENEVSKEMENGRLFRLLVKLGTINERPEYEYLTWFFLNFI